MEFKKLNWIIKFKNQINLHQVPKTQYVVHKM